jgi:parvulin-like peptidyl-prolyl isomerase
MAKKAKQQKIPGTEGERIGEIDEAAEQYVAARDARMGFLKQEIKYRDELIDLMKAHDLKEYEFDDNIVLLSELTKAKVKRRKESTYGEDEESNNDD